MVALRKDYPGDEIRRQHVEFCRTFWQLLAFESYKRSLTEGAGVLLVKETDFLNKSLSEISGIEVGFVTAATPGFEKVLSAQEIGWLKNHDFSTTLLIGFVRGDDGFSSYRIVGLPGRTPKEIFERMSSGW